MAAKMTSRERMLTAIGGKTPDYVPCSFMIFSGLGHRTKGSVDFIEKQVEMGLDAINCQVACMGAASLGAFRGRLTFWGEVDRQHVLPRGTRADVFAAVREMRAALYQDGGVIAQCEFGPGANPDNVAAVFEAWDAT